MAIAFDAASGFQETVGFTLTWSHTCTGSNLALFVTSYGNGTHASGVTYATVPLTNLVADTGNADDLWGLLAPATGANSVVVTYAISNFNAGNSSSYTGVKQTGLPDNSGLEAYPADNGATESISLTPTVDNCWVVGMAIVNANADTTAGAGTVIRDTQRNANGGVAIGDNNSAISPASSTTLNFVSSSAGRSGLIVSIAPAITATPKTSNLLLMGVG